VEVSQQNNVANVQCPAGVHVHPCSALVAGKCTNGFPVTPGCTPAHAVSPDGAERWHAGVPKCCDEEFVRDEQ
jgi:hypothetical protein